MLEHEEAGARDFRLNLTRHLIAAEHGGKATIVTRNGRPAAVLMPWDTVLKLAETRKVDTCLRDSEYEALHRLARLQALKEPAPVADGGDQCQPPAK